MVETFLSGFAQGYLQERNRRLEEQSRKDDLKFKYKMDYLTSQRELRTKKKQEEEEYARKAQDLAKINGDPDSAGVYYNELVNKVDYETLQKRTVEGAYVKNPNYTKPTQTVKVPAAVSAPTSYDIPGTDNEDWKDINADIDAIDPGLRTGTADEGKTTTDFSSNKDAYIFKPQNEHKIGEYDQALYDQQRARDAKDPVAFADATRKVEIHQRIMSEKAVTDARAKGEDVNYYLTLDDQGNVIGQVPARMEEDPNTGEKRLVNIADPRNPVAIEGGVKFVNDDDIKRYNALGDKFSEKTKSYDTSAGAYITALQTSAKITDILQRNKNAGTYVGTGVEMVNQLQGEARAAYEVVWGKEQAIQQKIASGDLSGIEGMVADYTTEVEKFNESMLSEGNQQLALDAAKLRGLKVAAAYQFAVAQGVATGKLSNQDFENNAEQIGANGPPESTIAKLRDTAQSAFTRLASAQASLDKDPAVADFEKRMGVKTSFRARRIGDKIIDMPIPEDQKKFLMEFNNSVSGQAKMGRTQAVTDAEITRQIEGGAEAPVEGKPDAFGFVKGQIYRGKGGKPFRYIGGGKDKNDPKNFIEVIE